MPVRTGRLWCAPPLLRALTMAPTSGIAAALTTSLPERIGGPRNFDYRFGLGARRLVRARRAGPARAVRGGARLAVLAAARGAQDRPGGPLDVFAGGRPGSGGDE